MSKDTIGSCVGGKPQSGKSIGLWLRGLRVQSPSLTHAGNKNRIETRASRPNGRAVRLTPEAEAYKAALLAESAIMGTPYDAAAWRAAFRRTDDALARLVASGWKNPNPGRTAAIRRSRSPIARAAANVKRLQVAVASAAEGRR